MKPKQAQTIANAIRQLDSLKFTHVQPYYQASIDRIRTELHYILSGGGYSLNEQYKVIKL